MDDKIISSNEKISGAFNCSLGYAMDILGSKWRAIILWHILKENTIRYSDLKSSIDRISDKVLSKELKRLEVDGLISRTQYPSIPPIVEYRATKIGYSLKGILNDLCQWGKSYIEF